MSSKENSVCSRRDFLRSLGRRFREQSQGVETDDTVRQGRAFFAQGDYAMFLNCTCRNMFLVLFYTQIIRNTRQIICQLHGMQKKQKFKP